VNCHIITTKTATPGEMYSQRLDQSITPGTGMPNSHEITFVSPKAFD
jgi:hypothetical protein